jgi:DNA-directed RNA polymerase I, II, and III subunit RPABC2
MPPAKKQDKKPEKKPEKKQDKKSKKVNFVSNKEDEVANKNVFIKESGTDGLELNETELETEKETELETELEEQEEQEEEEEDEQEGDEDHEVDDEIEYDDENVEEIDDLYDDDENIIKSKKKPVKTKTKKITSETEEDIKTNDLEDEDCDYDYNEIYDEKKEEPSIVVNPEDRITLPKLTKYERVRLIGTRAKQISLGAKVMVKNTNGLSSIDIAKLELSFKMIPMKVKRILPDNKIEIWKLSELELDN